MAEVVVVGAGMGGLAAAARLARAGHRVTVLEQATEIGGKLGVHLADGFRFDTGPSLLTMPHVFADLFAATGVPIEDVLNVRPVEPVAAYRFHDGTRLETTRDRAGLAERLDAALHPGAGEDWLHLLDRAARMWEAVEGPFLRSPLRGAATLARQAVRVRDLLAVAPWRTLRQLGRRELRDPRLRMLLERYATYTGSDPRQAPSVLATIAYVEQAYGAWYIEGGMHRLATALAERVEELGGHIRTSADVSAIEASAQGVTGVTLTDGELLRADAVVANADAAHLYADLVPPALTGRARRRLARTEPSLSGFVLLLGVRSDPGQRIAPAHHTVLFPADYDAEFDAVFGTRGPAHPVEDPTLYVSAPDDPAVAPPGHEAWFVLVNAPRHGPVDWDAPGLAESYGDRLLGLLADRGLDVQDRLVHRSHVTPADLERRTRAVGGAIYGTSSNGAAAAFLRPANRSPVRGLYLVGGSAHPGGGLPLVTLSAEIVTGMIGPA